MKPKIIFNVIILPILIVVTSHAQQDDSPVLKGSFPGQKPLGASSLSGQAATREPLVLSYVARIPLTIVRTLHGQTKTPMNLMYLFKVNGWRVFYEGDSSGRPDDFLGFGLESVPDGRIDKVRQYYKDIFVLLPGMPVRVFQK